MSGRLRLRAPQQDGGALIEPEFAQWPDIVAANVAEAACRTSSLGGIDLATFRHAGRRETIAAALAYTRAYRDVAIPADGATVLLTGHQPEMFHPGVWAKNFVLARAAANVGAIPIHLVIDGDTIKSAALRVPTGTPSEPRVEAIPFDGPSDEIPYEERGIVDAELWRSFGDRASASLQTLGIEPLLRTFWPDVVEQARETGRIGVATARARHRLEGALGLQTLELPQSALCETTTFRRFVVALLAELPRFVDVHNAALAEYRQAERIRSVHHPVPALERDGDWIEAPLWIWTAADPRRRRLFVRGGRDGDFKLTDRAGLDLVMPPGGRDDPDLAAWETFARRGIRLRSRALLTTTYARLALGDLFIHGIGGAKYDELTDVLIERFFGVRPPRFAVVTATRHLPIATPGGDRPSPPTPNGEQRLWQLEHHPERFIDVGSIADPAEADRAAKLIEEKRRWIGIVPTRATAKTRCRAIRTLNAELRAWTLAERDSARRYEQAFEEDRRRRHVLESREYAFCLFPRKDLCDFLLEKVGRQRYL